MTHNNWQWGTFIFEVYKKQKQKFGYHPTIIYSCTFIFLGLSDCFKSATDIFTVEWENSTSEELEEARQKFDILVQNCNSEQAKAELKILKIQLFSIQDAILHSQQNIQRLYIF